MHIENLYRPKAQRVLAFRQVWALEKIHGTTAHIKWGETTRKMDDRKTGNPRLSFFAGGVKHEKFVGLFDNDALSSAFEELGHPDVVVYGEAYGGKCKGMSGTYGKELRFSVFDVMIGGHWLDVPAASDVAEKLSLHFVPAELGPADIWWLDDQRDRDSLVAIAPGKAREGIVIRPPFEVKLNGGQRVIAKHKRPEFSEMRTARVVSAEQLALLEGAEAVAFEWVTPMRLTHVLDKLGLEDDMANTPKVISAMVEDVLREGEGEFEATKEVRRAICAETAKLYKARVLGG
jgi:hypothetical protein